MAPRKASVRSNRVCFTLNNYTLGELQDFSAFVEFHMEDIQFAIAGREVGDKKETPHLQGFIHCKTSYLKARDGLIGYWKKIPGLARAHFEAARGTDVDSEEYCSKEGDVLIKVGEPVVAGSRYDEMIKCRSVEEAINTDPELVIKHFFAIRQLCARNVDPTACLSIPDKFYPWQNECWRRLRDQNDRNILFVVDYAGGSGKSILSKFLLRRAGAFACQGGKCADLMHAFSKKPSAFAAFDMARSFDAAWFPYSFIENLKNGWFTSVKYDGGMFCFPPVKIVVFMNQDPPLDKFSLDRYDIMYVDQQFDKTVFEEINS